MRAVTLLSKERLQNVAITATVDEESACSYDARYIDEDTGVAGVTDVLCQGCGACVVACPSGASRQKSFEKEQMLALMKAAMF